MSWIFLAVSLVGAAFTWNAWFPSRRRRAPLRVPSFFAGWLTSELAAHHIAWQAVATVVFVAAGALAEWPGRVGLAVTLCSWAGLLGQLGLARRSGEAVERALVERARAALPRADRARVGGEARVARAARAAAWSPSCSGTARSPACATSPYVEGAGPRQRLDVYAPRGGARGAPVLLQIHGGGWTIGNKRQQALPLMMHLARRGWICVAANYRLSPRATFPEHLIDVKQALRWIRENIAEYGGDPGFVAITGGSAGRTPLRARRPHRRTGPSSSPASRRSTLPCRRPCRSTAPTTSRTRRTTRWAQGW